MIKGSGERAEILLFFMNQIVGIIVGQLRECVLQSSASCQLLPNSNWLDH